MGRRIEPVTGTDMADLPEPCRSCTFWELGPGRSRSDGAESKSSWIAHVTAEWGTCGFVATMDGEPAGFVLYAPPAYVPRAAAFATAPVSSDAALLTTVRVVPEFRNAGLGRVMIQSAARDLTKRGFRAIEAYAGTGVGCVLPVAFLEAVGFAVTREHPAASRMRLDLRAAVSWREDMEGALGRLVGVVRPYPMGARQS
jgi:GNAT superfamily N-acetyltransferase